MTRTRFMLVGAALPGLFGLVMMLSPGTMLDNSLATAPEPATLTVTRWAGFAVFSIACITFLARHDEGSPALRAVVAGNVVFHLLGIGMDVWGFAEGIISTAGLVTGVLPHGLLAVGFAVLLVRLTSTGAGRPVAAART